MTITFLPRRTHVIGRLTRARSIIRETVACLPTRTAMESLPAVNAGRWETLPGEYTSPWACPLDEHFPTIVAPGTTAPIACGNADTVIVHLAGTWSGHVVFEGSADGSRWQRVTLACLTSDVVGDACERPGLWRMLPGQHIAHLRLHITHLSYGAILASVAAAPALGQPIPRFLDSAA